MVSNQIDIHNSLITRLRLKIALLLALRYQLLSLAIFGFLFGTLVLVVRMVFAIPRQTLIWILPVFLPAVLWAAIRAIREIPSRDTLCALVDRQNRCGGLLMATREADVSAWKQRLPSLSLPVLKWHGMRSAGLFASAATFLFISFVVPQKYMDMSMSRSLDIGQDVEQLQQQIDLLKQESIISQEVAKEFDQKLEELQDTASAYDPVKAWEALDHLQENVNKEADQFAASSLAQTENLARTETLAEGLFEEGSDLDSSLLSDAMSELSAMVQSRAQEDELFKKSLSADSLAACKQGTLSEEQLKEVLRALKENKANLSRRLAKLCKAGLIDLDTLKLCEKLGACNSKGLVAFLNENASQIGMCDSVSLYCRNPGRGGVNRGRGDAPMTWSDGSSEENASFKEEVLPPASLASLKDSMMIGASVGMPSVEENQPASATEVLDSAAPGSAEAHSHVILPRHRGAVRRYFERE